MSTIRLAYRDHDRTPVIYCIKAMAERHYGVNVEVFHIHERQAFEDALLNRRCDTIIEHIEYLYLEATRRTQDNLLLRAADSPRPATGRSARFPFCRSIAR